MLQVDGSPHEWLEGRGARLCLIGAIDDATGKVLGALSLLRQKVPGAICGCSQRFSSGTACRSQFIAIGTRCFGPIEKPASMSN